jgi:hypothetical protein
MCLAKINSNQLLELHADLSANVPGNRFRPLMGRSLLIVPVTDVSTPVSAQFCNGIIWQQGTAGRRREKPPQVVHSLNYSVISQLNNVPFPAPGWKHPIVV